MKIEIELTEAQAALLMSSGRLHAPTLPARLAELVQEACALAEIDAEREGEERLYRTFGLTPPGHLFDDTPF